MLGTGGWELGQGTVGPNACKPALWLRYGENTAESLSGGREILHLGRWLGPESGQQWLGCEWIFQVEVMGFVEREVLQAAGGMK